LGSAWRARAPAVPGKALFGSGYAPGSVSACERACSRFPGYHRPFHEALPIRQMLSCKEHLPVRLLQNRPQRKPLPGPIESISALRVNIPLPGYGLNVERKPRRLLIKRQKIPRDDLATSLSILRRKHIGLFANRVTAKDALLSWLSFSAVK